MTGSSAQRLYGAQRGFDLVQVAEGLEDESVDSTLQQSAHLAAEERDRFVPGRWSPGLQPDTQRSDGTHHEGPPIRRATGDR